MITVQVDSRGFNAAFKDYMKHTKRELGDAINTKAFFISRNAVNLTDTTKTQKIGEELKQPSDIAPNAPLAAILVNKGRGAKGEPGLYGKAMRQAVNQLIRIRKNTRNFLRAGWIPAIKKLEKVVQKKSGPSYQRTEVKGQPKGGATSANNSSWRPMAAVWNAVTGAIKTHGLQHKGGTDKIHAILAKGLQAAVDKETASMKAYVEKKLNGPIKDFNRK